MSESFQTPFPTDLSRSQVFALKTTRPNETGASGPHSPVPRSSKPTVKRVYARKKSLGPNSSSRNLKENSFYSKSGSGTKDLKLNLRTKLRARRTTSFASLQDRRKETEAYPSVRLARRSSRASTRRSLDSPFCSQPSSPARQEDPATNAQIYRSNSKRDRSSGSESGDPALPEPKRRNSSNRLKNDFAVAFPFEMPLAPGKSSAPTNDASKLELNRRPSHPDLGLDHLSRLGDELGFLHAGVTAVDFNRPPSQLSIYAPAEPMGQAPLTRENSVTSNDYFAANVCAASTPYHANRVISGAQSPSASQVPHHPLEPSPVLLRRNTLDNLTENMSLTSVKETSILSNKMAADRTPWITDSLISPPTLYRRQHGSEQGDLQDAETELTGTTDVLGLEATLSSGSGSDNSPSTNDAPARENQLVSRNPAVCPDAGVVAGADNELRPHEVARRTRSGTIVAPAPVLATSAVAAPLAQKQARQRSGTITPNSATNVLRDPAPRANGRSRSGTITGTRPKSYIRVAASEAATGEGPEEEEVAQPHLDGDYDPTPADEMEFSSAPNPDIDMDLEDDMRDVTLSYSHASNPQPHAPDPVSNKAARKLKLPHLPLATEAGATEADSPSKGLEGSTFGKRSGKRMSLKAALGLNPKPTRRRHKQSTSEGKDSAKASVTDGPSAGPAHDGEVDQGALSSDPLDLLSHFDESDFNKPFEGLIKKSGRSRGRKAKGTGGRASK